MAKPRVISLVPSITETLMGWGVEPVAVTRFCEVTNIRAVGGTKNPDVDEIIRLRPDVVFMDEEENRRPDAEALQRSNVNVVATAVRGLEDVGPALARISESIGLSAMPEMRWEDPDQGDPPVQVFVPIWRRPWMTVGRNTYATSLLGAAGFRNVFGDHGEPYPRVELSQVTVLRAGAVLAPSEPYKFSERHRAELETVAPAVFVDGRDLFWWGGRTISALDRLRRLAGDLRVG